MPLGGLTIYPISPRSNRTSTPPGVLSANWASGILRRVKSLDGVSLSFGRTKAVMAYLQPSVAFGSASLLPPISTVLCHVTWRPASYSSGQSLPHPPSYPPTIPPVWCRRAGLVHPGSQRPKVFFHSQVCFCSYIVVFSVGRNFRVVWRGSDSPALSPTAASSRPLTLRSLCAR